MSAPGTVSLAGGSGRAPGAPSADEAALRARTAEVVAARLTASRAGVDRMLALVLAVQWLAGVALALWLTPRTWAGATASVHPHVILALGLGLAIAAPPFALALARPGAAPTRHAVAAAQMLASALLIHLTGGRIETHFHVFVSLALLAFYRDHRVLLTAAGVIVTDHLLRGWLAPLSVFGVAQASPLRALEHAGWVALEVGLLAASCRREKLQLAEAARRQAGLEATGARIERAVEERTAELVAAQAALARSRDEAQAASRAKGEFLANMSHEIRTPMNGVLGMTELALDGELPATAREQLELARSSAQALLAVVDDVLDLSKIEAGRLEVVPEPVALRPLLEQAVRTFAPVAHRKGLELCCRVDRLLPERVLVDPVRLRQVVNNLLGNAVKFTLEGEVALEADAGRGADGAPALLVSVRDTGIGVAADRLEAVFDAFTQADGSTTRRFGGTGLGLAISRRLARLMGGDLTATSVLGLGARFTLELPLEAAPAPEPARPDTDGAALVGRRVLVVDDNPTNRTWLREAAAAWGMEVDTADDGRPALELLRRAHAEGRPHDLVLLDLHMPGMNGFELLEALRRDAGAQVGATVVMVTSCDQPGTAERARQLGVADRLVKPVRPADLRAAALRALGAASAAAHGAAHGVEAGAAAPAADAAAEAPLRVLVAEDNPVNQRVVAGLLGRRGHEVVLVGDGAAAVAAARRGGFDALLLDVQMPVLDGWAAARAIRAEEARDGRAALPIVALTAHARREDEVRCREAGMNAFVTKPFALGRLLAAVREAREAVGAPARAHAAQGAEPPAPAAAGPALDRAALLARVEGDEALAAELVDLFRGDLPRQRAALADCATAGDPEGVRAVAHDLKGAAANVGATCVAARALDVERAAAAGRVDEGALARLAEALVEAAAACAVFTASGAALGAVGQVAA